MNKKKYNIAYNIAWTVIPILLLFGNMGKEYASNPLVWLGIVFWIIINVFLIVRAIKKSDVEEVVIRSKSEEIISDFSNITESFDDDEVVEIIRPLNNGEPVVEQTLEKNWVNIHNAFSFRNNNTIFQATSSGKNGVLFTWSFGNLQPTDITILVQAFPLVNPDDFNRIENHFLKSYSIKMQTDFTKGKLSIKHFDKTYNEWSQFSFKNPEKKKHCLEVFVMNKNNFLHMIVLESVVGDQLKQLKSFLPISYKN